MVYAGGSFAPTASFFGIDNPNFRGGARAAVGDRVTSCRGTNLAAGVVAAGLEFDPFGEFAGGVFVG